VFENGTKIELDHYNYFAQKRHKICRNKVIRLDHVCKVHRILRWCLEKLGYVSADAVAWPFSGEGGSPSMVVRDLY